MEIDIALCLPREAETVGIVRDVAVLSLMRLGVTKACAEDIRIALSEACTNVVDHSEAEDQYEVRLQVDGRRCEVRVIDTAEDSTSCRCPLLPSRPTHRAVEGSVSCMRWWTPSTSRPSQRRERSST